VSWPPFPRNLVRKLENENFPLIALQAIVEVRQALDEIERAALLRAQELGATTADIADALGVTRQAVHRRLSLLEEQTDSQTNGPDHGEEASGES
jgi:DNA-directed RNA polymerase specialized sigma24 family protein